MPKGTRKLAPNIERNVGLKENPIETNQLEPTLQYCILCDNIASTENGANTFVGVYDSLPQPATMPQLIIAVKWVDGLGDHISKVKLLKPDLSVTFETTDMKFTLNHRARGILLRIGLNNFTFEASGVYWIEVHLDNQVHRSIPFSVYNAPNT